MQVGVSLSSFGVFQICLNEDRGILFEYLAIHRHLKAK